MNVPTSILKSQFRGAWVAQSVKHPTLDFISGHDLTVHEFKPEDRLWTDSAEPSWDSLSLSVPPPFSLSQKSINKLFKKLKS